MELEVFGENMSMEFEVVAYVKTIMNNKDDLCVVCQVEDPEGECWDRYQLKCGHIFHSRCIRRWCGKKDTINCPLCGDIAEVKENRYCEDCDYTQYCMKQRSAVRMKAKKRMTPKGVGPVGPSNAGSNIDKP